MQNDFLKIAFYDFLFQGLLLQDNGFAEVRLGQRVGDVMMVSFVKCI
jgi:hypothetical protein